MAGTQFPADRRPVAGQDAVNGRAVILQISGGPLVLQIHQRLLHSSFIWSVADLLRGDYKQSEYGKIILPFTVLRRLDCVLEDDITSLGDSFFHSAEESVSARVANQIAWIMFVHPPANGRPSGAGI